MPRRSGPDEAIGPVLDGLAEIENLKDVAFKEVPVEESDPLEIQLPMPLEDGNELEMKEEDIPVVLLFGAGEVAEAVSELACRCGFDVELALREAEPDLAEKFPAARLMHETPDFLDVVDLCAIDRNFYICIFAEDAGDCETILAQCLVSQASYIGVWDRRESRDEIYARLKENGAPDSELAAVRCPMGLSIGADSREQQAVAIVAELLAARAGTLNRLRYDE